MQIPIKTDKDFERTMGLLSTKYGENFEILNGLHDSQLNFSDFIDGFVDKNVADVTIDANANASSKDIRSMLNEKGKPMDKLFAFSKIFYELKKKYGLQTAKEWLETEYNGGFYLHDAPSSTYIPYCFSGDTKIMTKVGLRRLDELDGKNVFVLNKNHGWEDATVKCFGKQELKKLTLTRYGVDKSFLVTGNHKWFVIGGNGSTIELDTDHLEEGMKIPFNTAKTWSDVEPSPFEAAYMEFPDLSEPVGYLYGWLAKCFEADGSVDDKGRCTLSSTNKEYLEFTRDVLCVLGMPVNEISRLGIISNLTGETRQVYALKLSSEYLREDFFIRPSHKERWVARPTGDKKHRAWIVKSVEDTGIIDNVYCAVAERTQSFTLDGNVLTHNCYAYDLTRLATEGLFFLKNYNNEPPKHLTTFLDDVIEFISFMSNRSSGAVGIPNILIWTFYFWKKDCESGHYIKDPEYYIEQCFQKFIYRLNQPFMRIDQTAFVNCSIFDRNYIESLFGGVVYPDGTFVIDYVDELIEHQKTFMRVVSDIRSVNLFTFPVLTYSLLKRDDITPEEAEEMLRTKNYDVFVDKEFARWCSDHNCDWNDSNFFMSSDVGTLSNCPMSGDTPILYWSDYYKEYKVGNIKDVYCNLMRSGSPVIKTISNGRAVECKINRFDDSADYEITLVNGASIRTTAGHLNKTLRGDEIHTADLTEDDYLPVSMTPYEESQDMCYEDGMLIGMFLGDGSYHNSTEVVFSLNHESKEDLIGFIYNYCTKKFGAKITENICESDFSGLPSCANVSVNSKYLRGLIEEYVTGGSALTKAISYKVLSKSMAFRRGILDGLYETDGGNSNRIYTSSSALKDTLVTMLASMGIAATVSEDNRPDRLGTNTNYTVRYYTPDSRTQCKDVYVVRDGFMWFKVKSISRVGHTDVSYCLQVLDENTEPIFMLPNGIYTHNCRLLSDTRKLNAFINSIGGTALSIGSVKVNTINLMRIALETDCDEEKYLDLLQKRALLCCKTLNTVRHIIRRNVEKGLLPNYQDGAIEMDKQYCTMGILGLYEVIEAFGYTQEDEFGYVSYTDEGVVFASKIFEVLNSVKDSFTDEYSFNIESVPAERAAVILCQKDNALYGMDDKFIYSNQWIPLSTKCTIQEKLRLCSILDEKCSGGSIAHINLESNFPSTDAAWDMLNKIALSGVIYFAFNTRINECKNHHGFVGTDRCPVCGEPVFDTYQRIVGYLVPSRAYSKDRFREFNTRRWYDYATELRE